MENIYICFVCRQISVFNKRNSNKCDKMKRHQSFIKIGVFSGARDRGRTGTPLRGTGF